MSAAEVRAYTEWVMWMRTQEVAYDQAAAEAVGGDYNLFNYDTADLTDEQWEKFIELRTKYVTAEKITNDIRKHADHDQRDHGNWARGYERVTYREEGSSRSRTTYLENPTVTSSPTLGETLSGDEVDRDGTPTGRRLIIGTDLVRRRTPVSMDLHYGTLEVDIRKHADHDQSTHGNWARGISSDDPSPSTIRKATPAEFYQGFSTARNGKYGGFLSDFDEDYFASDNVRVFVSHDGLVGAAVTDHGDGRIEGGSLYALPGAPPGAGRAMLRHLIDNEGVNWLNNFDGILTDFYEAEGFTVDTRDAWNDEYAPEGWDYDLFNHPDYVTMSKGVEKRDPRARSRNESRRVRTGKGQDGRREVRRTEAVPGSSVGDGEGVQADRPGSGRPPIDIRKHALPIRPTLLHWSPHFKPLLKSDLRAARRLVKKSGAPIAADDKNLVFGWASIAFTKDGTQVDDLQGHLIDTDDLEEMAYNFVITHRKTGEMHTTEPLGEMVESMVFTPEKIAKLGLQPGSLPTGWWAGFRVPPETFAKVKNGTYKMFSIQGLARLEELS